MTTPQKAHLLAWLKIVAQLTPFILSKIPGVPQQLAPFVAAGIQAAEQIPGADGPQKLQAAIAIVDAGFQAAQVVGAHKNVTVETSSLVSGISKIVQESNFLQHAQTS